MHQVKQILLLIYLLTVIIYLVTLGYIAYIK